MDSRVNAIRYVGNGSSLLVRNSSYRRRDALYSEPEGGSLARADKPRRGHFAGIATISGILVSAGFLLGDEMLTFGWAATIGLGGIYAVAFLVGRHKTRYTSLKTHSINLESALYSLSQIAESRDRELSGHSERVANNARALGVELQLQPIDLEQLWWAGMLHDVGKIGLTDAILRKPGPLTEVEKAEVRKHPVYGSEIVSPFCQEYPDISDAIRYHHERWDGLGYPGGLTKEQIPLFARILAVADVFEALTSSRPYREALTSDQAAIYINRESGSHFDPQVVRAFDVLQRSGLLEVATLGGEVMHAPVRGPGHTHA